MDFALTEYQRLIQQTAQRFAAENLAPHAAEWDENHTFPVETMQAGAQLGFAGIYMNENIGGAALGRLEAALIFEALSAGCTATAAFISIHNMAGWMIDRFAQPEIRAQLCPKLTNMDILASYCLTEPGAGSDAAALSTRAVRDGDVYVVDGTKAFISGAGVSDLYVVMVRTGEKGPAGITALVVEKDRAGLSFGAKERKMGWNSHPTAMVNFDTVRVPISNRLGAEGEGFKIAMRGLDGGRLNIAACSLGTAQAALEAALDYSRSREAFGRPISDNQSIGFKLADMATHLAAARALLYQAAWKLDHRTPDATQYCAMAKRFVTDICFEIVNEALQIHGGYGYLRDYPIERMLRDLRVHQILEGTNEIMRVIIARALIEKGTST